MSNEIDIVVKSRDQVDFSGAEKEADRLGGSFDKASEASDTAEGRFQGLASTLTGTTDTAAGLGEIAKGNLYEGLVMTGQGAADLAEGLNYTVIPMAKMIATKGKDAAITAYHAVVTKASTVATYAQAVATRVLNAAMRANPIGIVITLLVLLVGAIVVAYKKSDTFRAIVQAAMKGIVAAFGWIVKGFAAAWSALSGAWSRFVGWVQGWKTSVTNRVRALFSAIVTAFGAAWTAVSNAWTRFVGWVAGWQISIANRVRALFGAIVTAFGAAWTAVSGAWSRFVGWVAGWQTSIRNRVSSLFGALGSAFGAAWGVVSGGWSRFVAWVGGWKRALNFSGMFSGIASAFRSAINSVIGGWNRLSFSMPSVDTHIPGVGRIGGWTIHTPDLPYLAKGGRATRGGLAVVGEEGAEVVDLPGGASVWPANRLGGGPVVLHLHMGTGSRLTKALMEDLREQIRIEGGDVQVVLGP